MKSKIKYLLKYVMILYSLIGACSSEESIFNSRGTNGCRVGLIVGGNAYNSCSFIDGDCDGRYVCVDLNGVETTLTAANERSIRNTCKKQGCAPSGPTGPRIPPRSPNFPPRDNPWVRFESISSNNRFGFDSWRTIDIHNDNRHLFDQGSISYLSVGERDSTSIRIHVKVPEDYYDFFEVRIRNGSGRASFSQFNNNDTTKRLRNRMYDLSIFGIRSGTSEIEVWAKNNEMAEEVCIVGARDSAYERLQVKIFREHTFGRFNVYRANGVNAAFRPTTDQWISNFNNVLRQMVAGVDPFWTEVKDAAPGWDVNNNGVLDVIFYDRLDIMSADGIRAFNNRYPTRRGWQSEHYLLAERNSELNTSVRNNSHAHFIVRDTIRIHHVLRNNFFKNDGKDFLDLHCVQDILAGQQYRISRFYDPSDRGELIRILGKDPNLNSVKFERWYRSNSTTPLDNDYYAYDDNITIHLTGNLIAGFSVHSCSFATDRHDYNVHVHEFLHHVRDGSYHHVENIERSPYSVNMMLPFNSRSSQLRFRNLRTWDFDIRNNRAPHEHSQWDFIPGRLP